ncbi:MAG: FAD:protein FMN transferase [Propionibacteriaceae bacterium]|jgi:thiamine biosynthesis lipoprotein|nr:FAD:protein FMN transferase [Propionibacteriaceae bacterium]
MAATTTEQASTFFVAMGTVISLLASGADAAAALDQAVDLTDQLESGLSVFRPHSDVARLNAAAGQPVSVSAETDLLLLRADSLRQATFGAFDAMRGRGLALRVDHCVWRLPTGADIDLGAIGKGWAVDRILESWGDFSLNQAVVNFGESSIGFLGRPPAGSWRVGIRCPHGKRLLGSVRVHRGCLSTSSNHTGHIIDPIISGPAASDYSTVTVLGPSATDCEAWSTALMVRGTKLEPWLTTGLRAVVSPARV